MHQRARADNLTIIIVKNKLTYVFHASCLVVDNEFLHSVVKAAEAIVNTSMTPTRRHRVRIMDHGFEYFLSLNCFWRSFVTAWLSTHRPRFLSFYKKLNFGIVLSE